MKYLPFLVALFALTTVSFANDCENTCEQRYFRCSKRCGIPSPKSDCYSNCRTHYYECLSDCAAQAPEFAPGDKVKTLRDADLYSGSTVVGQVKAGEQFELVVVQGNWASLKKDNQTLRGWIALKHLEKTPTVGNVQLPIRFRPIG